jgi:trans-2,3-dihydro-3-hydroxyanthranilate isomerase
MQRRYRIFDVFTDRPFAGNPLAVVLDCQGLDDQAMQVMLPGSSNLSEHVFVLPSGKSGAFGQRSVFSPLAKLLPLAGHPTVGTAVSA